METQTPRDFLSSRTKETPGPLPTANSGMSPSDQCAGSAMQHQSSSAVQEHGLLTDKPAVRKALLGMITTLEKNFHAREDLLQEALVYLWLSEQQHPGQRRSWYLQSVNFYLHHIKASGRSLDSPKRRGAQAAFADNCDGPHDSLDSLDFDEGIMSEVNAHEIIDLLLSRLEPPERKVFVRLVQGLGPRQIARALHVSHQVVIRHRRKIAMIARTLGIVPVRVSSKRSARNR